MAVSWSQWHWLMEVLAEPSHESPELLEHRLLLLGQHKYPASMECAFLQELVQVTTSLL